MSQAVDETRANSLGEPHHDGSDLCVLERAEVEASELIVLDLLAT